MAIRRTLLLLVATLGTAVAIAQVQPPAPQSTATAEPLAFAVASIRPSKSYEDVELLRPLPDGIQARSITALALIRSAFGSITTPGGTLVSGTPDWVTLARFDVDAKADDSQMEKLRGLSPDERVAQFDLMLQALLADRFKLAIHKQVKDVPAYKMVLAKADRKPDEAASRDPEFPNGTLRVTRGKVEAQAISMDRIAILLSSELHRPVLNETGLAGRYDLAITLDPAETRVSAFPEGATTGQQNLPARPDDDGATTAVAIQKELGLKLKPSMTSSEVLVIDHIERPSEN